VTPPLPADGRTAASRVGENHHQILRIHRLIPRYRSFHGGTDLACEVPCLTHQNVAGETATTPGCPEPAPQWGKTGNPRRAHPPRGGAAEPGVFAPERRWPSRRR
jgi:hypothetical protein